MEYTDDMALSLVKTRLNKLPSDTALDAYLMTRIHAARAGLARAGIYLESDSADDLMLLVDMTVWQYQNRDAASAMPPWLSLRRRERWLAQRKGGDGSVT